MKLASPSGRSVSIPRASTSRWARAKSALVLLAAVSSVVSVVPATAVPLAGTEDRGRHIADNADAKAEVIVLYGSNDNSGIDASLGKIPALSKPPFSSYNSYKLLERKEHALTKGDWVNQVLPDQNTLNVSLKSIDTKDDETRYVVDANIKKPDGSSYFPNLEVSAKKGEYFFVGGPKFKDGVLVIGIRIL